MAEAENKALTFKFPNGIDNRSREYALPEGALRTASNLDVTRDGGLLCRKGLRSILSGDFHSFFVHPRGQFAVVVKDNSLCRLTKDNQIVELSDVVGTVYYAVLNDEIYWMDQGSIGRITSQGELATWGLNSPPPPQASLVEAGGLIGGSYRVAMTAVNASGLESPASEVVTLDVPDGWGVSVTTPTASGVNFAIYRTEQNGPVELLRQAVIAPQATTVLLSNAPIGKRLEGLYAVRPFAGQCLVAFKGRLWCATGNVLWFTSELSPHCVFPSRGFYQFESSIQLLGAAEDGIYVGLADRIYYLQGSNAYEMTQRPVASVGAARGSVLEVPYDLFLGQGSFPSRQCAFLDRDGYLCVGKPGGILVRTTQERYSAGNSEQGVLAYCVHDGLRQVLMANSVDHTEQQASDIIVSEVFANGVALNAI